MNKQRERFKYELENEVNKFRKKRNYLMNLEDDKDHYEE